jgi:hypothetical protein
MRWSGFKNSKFSVSIFQLFSISPVRYDFSLIPNGEMSKFSK